MPLATFAARLDAWRDLAADERERQYNPRVTVPDFQRHLDAARLASEHARTSLRCLRDLRYGPRPRQCIDVYPADAEGAPAVVYVHGGFWRALSKEQAAGIALSLHTSDITTAVVGYDLCPDETLDTIVDEIDAALDWCARALPGHGVDPARMHLAGSSAGAHLIATALFRAPAAGTWRERYRSAWLVSGIYELAPVRAISVNADIRLDDEAVARLSPLRFPARVPAALTIAVGADETPSWIAQSRAFADAARRAGNDVDYLEVPGAHHFSVGAATDGSLVNARLRARVGANASRSKSARTDRA